MLKSLASNLGPCKFRLATITLCVSSAAILIAFLVACAGPKSAVEATTQNEPASLAATIPEPASEAAKSAVPETTATFLQVSDLKITPAEVNPGQKFLITANLKNAGDSEGAQKLELMIDNIPKLATKATIPAGEIGEFQTIGTEEVPGVYTVSLNGVTGQLTVRESADSPIASNPDPEPANTDQEVESETPSQSSGASSGKKSCCGS